MSKQLGSISLGLGIAAWALMFLQFMVPGVGCIFGSITPLLAIAAIIVGVIALGGEGRGNGMIGMILGIAYLVVSIIIAIVGLLFAGLVLCIYFGFFAIIFGGIGLCGNILLAVVPLTLMGGLAAAWMSRLPRK